MKKMLCILFVIFITVTLAYPYNLKTVNPFDLSTVNNFDVNNIDRFKIEEVAGFEDYEIYFGLRNFVATAYGPFMLSLSLPVSEKFKLAIRSGLNLGMGAYTVQENVNDGPQGRVETQNWAFIDTDFECFVGLPLLDYFELSLMLGGGTYFRRYDIIKNTFTDVYSDMIRGFGYGVLGVGLLLKSGLFNDKIGDMAVRQYLHVSYGNGNSTLHGSALADFTLLAIADTSIVTTSGVETSEKNEFLEIDYYGLVGFGIPFEIGLPKFELGFQLEYVLNSVNYMKMDVVNGGALQAAVYSQLPSALYGGAGLKVNLAVNPLEHIENNIWIKPAFVLGGTSYTDTGRAKETIGSSNVFMSVGADWKVLFAKIVWIRLDAVWTIQFMNTYTVDENTGQFALDVTAGGVVAEQRVDPGITIGFNFEGWNAEFKWNPSINVPGWTDFDNDDSNIWNLRNWTIEVSCKFPPL